MNIKSISSRAIWPLLVKLAGTIVAFILSVVLARVLGVSEFGAYSFIISAIMVVAIPIQSGLPTLATREVARFEAANRPGMINLYITWSNHLILKYLAAVTVVAMIFRWAAPQYVIVNHFPVALISVATIAITLRNGGVLRGLGRFVVGTAGDVLVRPAVQLIAISVVVYFSSIMAQQALWALLTFVGASGCACFVTFLWQRAVLKGKGGVREDVDRERLAQWRKSALLLTVVGGGQILFGHIDTLMLGLLGSEKEVGAYRVAVQLSMLVIFVLAVVNQVLQPSLSRLHTEGDTAAFQKLVADSSFWMFVGTLIPALTLALAAPQLLEFVFGTEYRAAAPALQILIFGQVMNVLFGSVGTILSMTGLEREAMRGMIVAIIINLALDVALIPTMGLTGAALASALTIVIWNLILRHYVKIRLGIESVGVIVYARQLVRRQSQGA